MTSPDISVIIPVYNAMPYLRQAVQSVAEQSIGLDRLEIITIDDGSTDGSAEELERLAARYPRLRVFHQPNSGGESRPRNLGLDTATGRFVMFVDHDDYLGSEALERMLAVADANNSDIVLGKYVGTNGRPVPTSMFRRNEARADLATSPVWLTRTVHKLFRREFIERLGLRFHQDLPITADQVFTATAYFDASVVSVVADYDCYYLRGHADGRNFTSSAPAPLYTNAHMEAVERMRPLVMRRTEPGPFRDHVSIYHFQNLARRCLGPRLLDLTATERSVLVKRVAQALTDWYTPEARARLAPADRVRLHLAAREDVEALVEFARQSTAPAPRRHLVADGRILAAEPFLRDPRVAVPDECYDITAKTRAHARLTSVAWHPTGLHLTGYAFIEHVDTVDQTVQILLRDKDRALERRVPATVAPTPEVTIRHGGGLYNYDRAGFTAVVDPQLLVEDGQARPGRWEIHLGLCAQGIARELRPPVDGASTVGNREAALPAVTIDTQVGTAGHVSLRVRPRSVSPAA